MINTTIKIKVKLDKVHYKVVKDSQTSVNMYESKDLDITGLTPENIKSIKMIKNSKHVKM